MSAAMEALHIRHFKCFQETRIPVSPLTLLTGMNGAGKSTTIQSLLLMRAAELAEHEVSLNGPFGLALGEASDVIHREADFEHGLRLGFEREGVTAMWHLGAGDNVDERRPALRIVERAAERIAPPGRGFVYLCAERLGPRDALAPASVSDHEVTVGAQGENTAQVLELLDRKHPVELARRHPGAPKNASTLLIHVEHWASSIIRPMQIQASWVPGVAVTTLRFRDPGSTEWTRPFNTGFGVSYALPLIVAALTVPVGGVLVVENPEAHLHPAGQSAMGHLLARVAADGVQVFVETHSDHVLNGVRRAIGVDRLLPAERARCIFFGAQGAEGEPWTSLGFTEAGGVERWPALFFDQYQMDVALLAKVRRSKRASPAEEGA